MIVHAIFANGMQQIKTLALNVGTCQMGASKYEMINVKLKIISNFSVSTSLLTKADSEVRKASSC